MPPTSNVFSIRWRLPTRAQTIRFTRGLGFVVAYAAWIPAFRLLALTFVTYFLMSSPVHAPRFEDISEVFSANELSMMGLSALLFVGLLRALHPITMTSTQEIFTPEKLEKQFIPGFLHGAVLATGVALAFLLSGVYRYLGFFFQFDEAPFAALTVLARIAALGAFAYCEEYIFRRKITRDIQNQIWGGRRPSFLGQVSIALLVAIIYVAIKTLQFDLGAMQLLTAFLLSLALSARTFVDQGDFGRGAGFWAGLLIVFQPLLSLPVLGGDFSGVVLMKLQATLGESTGLTRLLGGGLGGPLSSFAFQLVLILDVVRGFLLLKKRIK